MVDQGAGLSTLPVTAEFTPADRGRVYVGRARIQIRAGLLLMLFSLAGLTQLHAFLRWYHGGQIPDPKAFLVLGCLLLLPLGLVALANAVRGLPRLTVG